jgi:hypothetical protein
MRNDSRFMKYNQRAGALFGKQLIRLFSPLKIAGNILLAFPGDLWPVINS